MKDLKAKILSNEEIGPAYYKMALDAPYIARAANPGQFVMLKCDNDTDPFLRRPVSIHRVRDKAVEILYEVIGKGTKILSEKQTGETIDVLGPLGTGFTLPAASSLQPRALLIAGGIGVAPLIFLAEELVMGKIKSIVLLGARTEKLILCEKDFKKIGAEVHIATDDGSKGYKGFISDLFEKLLVTSYELRFTKVYACGPEPMLKGIATICRRKDVHCQVSLETMMACGIGACLGCAVETKNGNKLACKDGPIFNAGEIIW